MNKKNHCTAQPLKKRIADSRDRLYRVALAWCGDEMLADDLVQETMAAGIFKRHQLRDETRLFAWLYSILNNSWKRHLRKSRPHDDLDEQLPSEETGPYGNCQEREIVSCVRRAVATLPLEQRQVIAMVDLEEFSYCDVARILDVPIGTVMSRLHRARKNLLAKLEKTSSEPTLSKGHMHIVK